jgi:AcrR family transcriptional regulator
VGPGTLYRHFPAREHLLCDVLLAQHHDSRFIIAVAWFAAPICCGRSMARKAIFR